MLVFVVSTLGLGLLSATAAVTTSPIPGYAVQEVAWEVQATPGGPYLRLNGTVQEVFNQLRQVNPTFDTDFGIDLDSYNRRTRVTTSSTNSKYQVESNTCLPDRDTANLDIILNEGIPYLRSVPGQPGESGRGVCGRVSCSWKSAIWWCIDQSTLEKQLDSFGAIADGAQYIADRCQEFYDNYLQTSGQVYYTDGWSVVVKGDFC